MFTPPPFHERRPGLIAPARVDPVGIEGPTRGEARGRRWRTTSHGLQVPADVVLTTPQRTVEAAAVLGVDEAVTGWAALSWAGAAWFDGTRDGVDERPVPLVVRRHVITQAGALVSQEFLNPAHIHVIDALPVTSHVRSVTFEMRYADGLGAALEAIDMACYSDRHVGTPDLIDPATGLVGLYHGASHLSLVGASKDNRQDSHFRDIGLEPIAMFATDWHDLGDFTRRLGAAEHRARTRGGPRAWTIDPPPWWTPTNTVARRRALADWQRERYLRYRRAA